MEDSPDDIFLFMRAARTEAEAQHMRIFPVTSAEIAQEFLCCKGQFEGRVDQAPPGLIVTDIKMPKMNGLEFVHWARSQTFLNKVPIVVMSSSDQPRDVKDAYEFGANCYILKPNVPEEFNEIVRAIAHYWCDHSVLPEGNFVRKPAVSVA